MANDCYIHIGAEKCGSTTIQKSLEINHEYLKKNKIDDFFEEFTQSQTALKRLPSGGEVGEMVVFLASEKASAITGQCINVDCGVFPQ